LLLLVLPIICFLPYLLLIIILLLQQIPFQHTELMQKRIQKQYEAMLPEEKVSPKNGRNLYDTDDEASVDSDDSGI